LYTITDLTLTIVSTADDVLTDVASAAANDAISIADSTTPLLNIQSDLSVAGSAV
jgi:hypothetical protein